MKSLSLPGMPGKLAAPVTPHHSMKLAENHMPKRAEEDGLEHRTVVLHREELREEVRLTDAEEGPHDDHRRIVLPGIGVVVARELQVVRVHGRELGVMVSRPPPSLSETKKVVTAVTTISTP